MRHAVFLAHECLQGSFDDYILSTKVLTHSACIIIYVRLARSYRAYSMYIYRHIYIYNDNARVRCGQTTMDSQLIRAKFILISCIYLMLRHCAHCLTRRRRRDTHMHLWSAGQSRDWCCMLSMIARIAVIAHAQHIICTTSNYAFWLSFMWKLINYCIRSVRIKYWTN